MSTHRAYRAPAGRASSELKERGSRFLAIVEPVADERSARDRVRALQQQFCAATHVCWAWRIGMPVVEERSDAGEPAGTAGNPMLQVLRGAVLSDVLAVVVRWFGGVKLGKGGLARAYAGVLKQTLGELPIENCCATELLRVLLPYDRVGSLKRLVHPPTVEVLEESYGDRVEVLLRVDRDQLEKVEESLRSFALDVSVAGN